MTRRNCRRAPTLLLTALLVGCNTGSHQSPDRQSPIELPQRKPLFLSADGMALRQLSVATPGYLFWSPSGKTFAYMVDPKQGTAVIGTTAPFHTENVEIGRQRRIVALTERYVIVASRSFDENWLYPLRGVFLGKPIKWRAPTDTWQEWVQTWAGPAVVTGGYKSNSVALTLSDGKTIPLDGGQVYLSTDHRFGAVATRTRFKRVVYSAGGIDAPSEYQPSPATEPIVLWDFASAKVPRRLTTIHLPTVHLPKAADSAIIQTVLFSPDDHYVCVLVTSEVGTSGRSLGQTFVFSVNSGHLMGTAPYGNGVMWTPDSKCLWLRTPWPEGKGDDRIVNVQGRTVWLWPDRSYFEVVTPLTSNKQLVVIRGRLGVLQKDAGFYPFHGVNRLDDGGDVQIAPYGKAALVKFRNSVMLLKFDHVTE
jgi:hypothetical protein